MAFPIVKAILSGAVIDKIKVFGKEGWKEELLELIDADVLPAFLGGNRTDPDENPKCNTIVNHAGYIPEHYYLTKNVGNIQKKANCQSCCLDRHKRAEVLVEVAEPGSVLHWEFETKYYDIGFGIYKNSSDSDYPVDLIPVHKVDTENKPETGMLRCKSAGTYVIVFDNSYSWFHSKVIYYRTWITKPVEEENSDDFITIEF
ncbi:hypothetical protein JTE90_010128 [Oedothorax gibbosus]|uniref:GOLD domain-containing protein n=1 Tax=Oedothorax gibbosus TaxID=931172 RepID=A0AAV6TMP9_9ARAC|nr:hypothetical protein JTE90_010128 [Oedothorax gibbosus]